MVSIRTKRQQKGGLLSQLDEFADDFMRRLYNQDFRIENRTFIIVEHVASTSINHLITVNGSQMDMQPSERGITQKMPHELDNI